MQRHATLMALALEWHHLDVRLLGSYSDGLCVHGVCFVPQQESQDVLSGQEFDLMAQDYECSSPIVSAPASLYRDETGFPDSEELFELSTIDLAAFDLAGFKSTQWI